MNGNKRETESEEMRGVGTIDQERKVINVNVTIR